MLEVRQLVKRYNRIPAVDGVSFSIRPGEILGYVGPNGAGKSTTVKVLTGLIEPTSGEILFQGRDVLLAHKHMWHDGIPFDETGVRISSTAEIELTGPTVMEGYHGDPVAAAKDRPVFELRSAPRAVAT